MSCPIYYHAGDYGYYQEPEPIDDTDDDDDIEV